VLDMFSADLPKVKPQRAMGQLAVVALMLATLGVVLYKVTPESPVVPREYPFSGLVKELGGLEENKVGTSLSVAALPLT
jgi:NADH dehydrogenase (ubiquinone) 1 beta subcomplex subunit 8